GAESERGAEVRTGSGPRGGRREQAHGGSDRREAHGCSFLRSGGGRQMFANPVLRCVHTHAQIAADPLSKFAATLLTMRLPCYMIFYMKLRSLLLAVCACALGAGGALAATATTTFTVTATVSANCTISATGITFTYDPVLANA